jgi:predicted ATPase/class 3 adenylate cyclase
MLSIIQQTTLFPHQPFCAHSHAMVTPHDPNTSTEPLSDLTQRTYRPVASLSYDLVNSTDLMETVGIEAYALMLEQLHVLFSQIVHKWEGAVDTPHNNDGCMCYFGLLQTQEQSRYAALMASLEMLDLARENGWPLRIGIAYSQVAIHKNQPVGRSVHLAARLQKMAAVGTVWVAAELAHHMSRRFQFRMHELPQGCKGFEDVDAAFELLKAKDDGSSYWDDGGESSRYLYGRQKSLLELRRLWLKVQAGVGTSVHVQGPAGIGKTALLAEFMRTAPLQAHTVLTWLCQQEQRHTAYLPIIKAMLMWAGITSNDGVEARLQKVSKRLAETEAGPLESWTVRFLLDLPMRAASEPLLQLEDPQAYSKRISQGVLNWLQSLSQGGTFVLVVEDMHWCDPSTLQVLNFLHEHLSMLPLLLLSTQRTLRDEPALLSGANHCFALEPLNFEESNALVQHVCGSAVLPHADLEWLIHRAQGIPLFIHESARLAQQHLYKTGTGNTFPHLALELFNKYAGTVGHGSTEILMQRIDALGNQRVLVQMASALGSDFEMTLLKAVAQTYLDHTPDAPLMERMVRLVNAGIFQTTSQAGGTRFAFTHALLREVAYQSMWVSDRKKLHAAVLAVYEQNFPEVLQSQPEWMVQHWLGAGDHISAVQGLLRAAQKSKKKGAHQICIECCDAALEVLRGVPGDEVALQLELRTNLLAAGQLMATKGYGTTAAGMYFHRALNLSQQLKDHKSLVKAQLGVHSFHLLRGRFDEAENYLKQGRKNVTGDHGEMAQLLWQFAQAMLHFYRGQMLACAQVMNRCSVQSKGLVQAEQLTQSPLVMSLMYRAFCLWTLGQVGLAHRVAREGVEAASQHPSRLARIQAFGILAMLQYIEGDWLSAGKTAQDALDAGQEGEYALWLNLAEFVFAASQTRLAIQNKRPMAEVRKGFEQMRQADGNWASSETVLTRPFYLASMAECHLLADDCAAAQQCLNEAQDLIRSHGERYFSTEVLRVQAVLWMREQKISGWADQSRHCLNQAYADAHQRGMHMMALRVVEAMQVWEETQEKPGAWLDGAWCAADLRKQCLLAIQQPPVDDDTASLPPSDPSSDTP